MATRTICDVEDFVFPAVPQPDAESNASAMEINLKAIEGYLRRLREAACADIDSIIADCCDGGGGGGGGADSFLELSDTPASYAGSGSEFVRVNAGATGLVFSPSTADSDGLVLNYSTVEQQTNRSFLAEGPIFQKSLVFGALPSVGSKDVAHGITGLLRIITFHAVTRRSSDGAQLPLPFASPTDANNIQFQFDATNVRVTVGLDRSAFDQTYVTLFYTKS